jgi:hypothetical protein
LDKSTALLHEIEGRRARDGEDTVAYKPSALTDLVLDQPGPTAATEATRLATAKAKAKEDQSDSTESSQAAASDDADDRVR